MCIILIKKLWSINNTKGYYTVDIYFLVLIMKYKYVLLVDYGDRYNILSMANIGSKIRKYTK